MTAQPSSHDTAALLMQIKILKDQRNGWQKVAHQAGVCMTCAMGAPDTFGCSDCLNTGWEGGASRGFEHNAPAQLPASPVTVEKLAVLVGYLESRSDLLTKSLDDPSWTPRRAHTEVDRNAFLAAANTLQQALRRRPAQCRPLDWPEPSVTNPDIANPTGIPYIDSLIHRLLDAQQDINLEANARMSQSLCDASALVDEIETALRKLAALPSTPSAPVAQCSPNPADDIIGQIEARFPDWRGFRDLVDCIDVTLHRLREGSR